MNEPVIDIRDRIEKMRNQMTPQSSQNKKDSIIKTSKNFEKQTDKLDSEKKDSIDIPSKDKDAKEHKKSISEDIVDRKREFNKNFEDTETITKINVEQNNKTGDYFSSNTSQKSQNESKPKSKSVKQEEATIPQFSLNVSNPISWKLMLLIMVMQLLTNIMLVVVLYLK